MAEKKNILAVDDDPVTLRILSALLAPYYNLQIAKSAMEATVLMVQIQPDLILLDIEMPNVSGFEFLQTIRKNPKFMNIPVIIASSHSESEFAAYAEKSGASSVVTKPLNKEELLQKITNVFEHSPKMS